ncbi:DUF2750 domain-containing protein [Prosthecobacter sp.]|jgi:hypothetical protein|uniref:DUF2750 domain-containing protein n=1 Tax=Prosthecobacter sp. TaxID=1965333 RepID=UPI0037C789EA
MSQAASQWAAFAREVAAHRRLWTVEDDVGYPAPLTSSGARAQPFWSSLPRVERIISTVPAYSVFRPCEVSWEEFRDRWIPDFVKDGTKIGVNWSGPRATGYDIDPADFQTRVEYEISQLPTGTA